MTATALAAVGSNANESGTLIISGTAVASTSGTSIDFTGIPSYAKRITVMFSGTSLSASANYIVQLGTGATPTYTTSGYLSYCSYQGATNAVGNVSSTSGFVAAQAGAANLVYGAMTIMNINSNVWVANHATGINASGTTYSGSGGGNVTLGAALTAVRITTTSTDTFDAGTINIMWE
jgi:hypothetical protein